MRTALAITASDIHLSHRPPLVRTAEPDWYEAMERQLVELQELASYEGCPIIYAGDIFHKYNPPPKLINFAIKHLPNGYAIPGQHDLPHHVYSGMDKTAYGCLVSAGVLVDLLPDVPQEVGDECLLFGYPWGTEFTERPELEISELWRTIAVVHKYVWMTGRSYKGAKDQDLIMNLRGKCDTYDFVVFGDNHKGFQSCNVVNNGTFMRRNADELGYQPCVSVLWSDGEIERVPLRCVEEDRFLDDSDALKLAEKSLDMSEFITELSGLGADSLDFIEALKRFCDAEGIDDNVRSTIMEAAGQ